MNDCEIKMRKLFFGVFLAFISFLGYANENLQAKQPVHALYIPLADHYAAIVAYELYRDEMKYADFTIEQITNWDLLRVKFLNNSADMAFVMAPLAMSMFNSQPSFRWVGLMHRDGNGLAISPNLMQKFVELENANEPKALSFKHLIDELNANGKKLTVGVPHVQSTHSVILFNYLKQQGLTLGLTPNDKADVVVRSVSPPKSPAFVLGNSNLMRPVAIEQSLPWINLAETQGVANVLWYSKDVLSTEKGHVECIALASNAALASKEQAVAEVFQAIKKAGLYIETVRARGREQLTELATMIRKHIPAHTVEAIKLSLNPKKKVINYHNLDVDRAGLKQIMSLAVESGVLKQAIDIDNFAFELEQGISSDASRDTSLGNNGKANE